MGIPGALDTMHLNSNILKPGFLRDNSTATSDSAQKRQPKRGSENAGLINHASGYFFLAQ